MSRAPSVLDDLPADQATLLLARELTARAATVGFDWPDIAPVWDKVREELEELRDARETGDAGAVEAELGDLLLALTNLSRFLGVDPERALRGAMHRFSTRFRGVEVAVHRTGRGLEECELEELDRYWEAEKSKERLATSGASASAER